MDSIIAILLLCAVGANAATIGLLLHKLTSEIRRLGDIGLTQAKQIEKIETALLSHHAHLNSLVETLCHVSDSVINQTEALEASLKASGELAAKEIRALANLTSKELGSIKNIIETDIKGGGNQ